MAAKIEKKPGRSKAINGKAKRTKSKANANSKNGKSSRKKAAGKSIANGALEITIEGEQLTKKEKPSKTTTLKDIREDWLGYAKVLNKKSRQRFPNRVFKPGTLEVSKRSPFLWGFSDSALNEQTISIAKACHRISIGKKFSGKSQLLEQLETIANISGKQNLTLDFAIQLLAVCAAFPRLAGLLPDSIGRALIDQIAEVTSNAAAIDPESEPLVAQLLHGELPILAAATFGDVDDFAPLTKVGVELVRQSVDELLDGNGLPRASVLPTIQPLAASWIRTKAVCDSTSTKLLNGNLKTQLSHLIEQLFRFLRNDGTQVFTGDEAAACSPGLIAAALQVDNSRTNPRIAKTLLKEFADKKAKKRTLLLPETSDQSEWAEIAAMQSDWEPGCPKLIVDWSDRKTRLELNTSSTILSGEWDLNVTVARKKLKPESDWSVACWFSDDDCDFLELEIELENDFVVQRQLMLGRTDHILLLADVVIGKTDAKFSYESALPVVDTSGWAKAKETHEGFLRRRVGDEAKKSKSKRVAAFVPLALPEWQSEQFDGGFDLKDDKLTYQSAQQKSGYFPLFVDLDPRRIRQPLTWRRLTVGESLRIVEKHEAAGFRVQIGDGHWMFYRSLTELANRTLLGQNLACEFYAAEFDTDGETSELISID